MRHSLARQTLTLDGNRYAVSVQRTVTLPPDAPRLAIVSCLPNALALEILRACIQSFQTFTAVPAEIWVVDNASDPELANSLLTIPGVNVVLNTTVPVPPESRAAGAELTPHRWGSYANAVGLELIAALVDPATRWFGTFHMDTMAVHPHWLTYLLGKMDGRIAAAGVRLDRTRTPTGVLHVLGMVLDFNLFRRLGLSFYPQLPGYDVGDLITLRLRSAGYDVHAARNTLWDRSLVESIAPSSLFRDFAVDRTLDDSDTVIFLHLGRGVGKSTGDHATGVTAEDWIELGRKLISGREVVHASIG